MEAVSANDGLCGCSSIQLVEQWLRRKADFNERETAAQSHTLKRIEVEHAESMNKSTNDWKTQGLPTPSADATELTPGSDYSIAASTSSSDSVANVVA